MRRNSLPDVDPDEIYAALDEDTRPYLKLLVSGAGKGLRGRGDDLRRDARRLEPLHRDLARVTPRHRAPPRGAQAPGPPLRPADGRAGAPPGRAAPPGQRVGDGVRRARLRARRTIIASRRPRLPGRAAAVREHARGRRRLRARSCADARRPCARPIRRLDRDQRGGPALPARDHADPARPDPAVRARGAAVDAPTCARRRVTRRKAAPDLTKSLRRRLNRFFNIGAFNPGGAEGLGRPERRPSSAPARRASSTGSPGRRRTACRCSHAPTRQGPWRRVTICGLDLGVSSSRSLQLHARCQLTESDPALLRAGLRRRGRQHRARTARSTRPARTRSSAPATSATCRRSP